MTTPCPNCVETIADLRQAVSDAIHNAYVSGALDVHNNYQEDRVPSFGEAAADYVASLDVNDMLAKFLPKSPAQRLAEECPHGMTEEQAQWVLDHFSDAQKAAPTDPTDAVGFNFTDDFQKSCKNRHEAMKLDSAPRYVFGPWVEVGAFENPLPEGAEFQALGAGTDILCNPISLGGPCTIRRAYRLFQPYDHDGGECPLADGSVRVMAASVVGARIDHCFARDVYWPNVTSFIILDLGSGQ